MDKQAILMKKYMQVKEVEKGISSYLGSVISK
jgi:DNA primase